MKKQITKSEARNKYGIVITRFQIYKYYLLDNGDVIDSDGDTRYLGEESYQKALQKTKNNQ